MVRNIMNWFLLFGTIVVTVISVIQGQGLQGLDILDGGQVQMVHKFESGSGSSGPEPYPGSSNYGWELVKQRDDRSSSSNSGTNWFGSSSLLGKRRKRSSSAGNYRDHDTIVVLDRRTLLNLLHNHQLEIVPVKDKESKLLVQLRNPESFRRIGSFNPDKSQGQGLLVGSSFTSSSLEDGGELHKYSTRPGPVPVSSSDGEDTVRFAPRNIRDHISPRLG